MDTGERVDSVARPARSRPHDARHIARHSCSPLLGVPPPFPFRASLPPFCPLGVHLGSTRFLVGLLHGGVGGGGGSTLGPVPPSGSFPTGGPMHAFPVKV